MPSSQEFRKALQAGKIQEAFTLALTEAVELKITTWVSSSNFDASNFDDVDVAPREIASTIASRESADAAKPGHRLRTNINLMQGDIEHEIGDRFLENNAYRELLQFHFTQVDKGQQIIEQNIHSLQKIFSLVTSLKNPPSDSSPAAIALEEAPEDPFAEIESTGEDRFVEGESLATEAIAEGAEETLNGNILENLATVEEEFQQRQSDVPSVKVETSEVRLEEELPSVFTEEEETFDIPLVEAESNLTDENLDFSEHGLEEEALSSNSRIESSLETEVIDPSPQDIQESEAADHQTEAFIDTLFSSDDWIEEELSDKNSTSTSSETANSDFSTPSEQLEIEGWDRSSNLHLSEPIAPLTEEIAVTSTAENPPSSETSESDIFQLDESLAALSDSEEELDLEDWEFSSEGIESEGDREEPTSDLESLEIEELTPSAAREDNLDNVLTSELSPEDSLESEENSPSFEEIDNPWDAPEPELSSLEALSLDEEENNNKDDGEKDDDEEEEDWGDFVKFVEQDLPTSDTLPVDDLPDANRDSLTENEAEDFQSPPDSFNTATSSSTGETIATLEEEWETSSEAIDPFTTSQSDSESYTSIVEEDWEEFAIEELEPYPKSGEASWQEPLFEETVATASIDEILDDPPELIDEEIAEFSESELDRAWDEELFGDEFNFDISLSDEADMPSDLLEVEAKQKTSNNS